MKLTSALKNANPVPRSTQLSPRGRAELRALVGTQAVPLVKPARAQGAEPARVHKPFRVWLAPSLAAALLVGGITAGMYASHSSLVAQTAWADTISVPTEVIPTALGSSFILDVPLPADKNGKDRDWVARLWYAGNPSDGWLSAPTDMTFKLVNLVDDTATYEAQAPSGTPIDPVFEALSFTIVGPQSSQCFPSATPSDVPEPDTTRTPETEGSWVEPGDHESMSDDPSETTIATISWNLPPVWLCDVPASAEPPAHPLSIDRSAMISVEVGDDSENAVVTNHVSFQVSGITDDPAATIAVLKQFELDPDGTWTSVPAGYEDWSSSHVIVFVAVNDTSDDGSKTTTVSVGGTDDIPQIIVTSTGDASGTIEVTPGDTPTPR